MAGEDDSLGREIPARLADTLGADDRAGARGHPTFEGRRGRAERTASHSGGGDVPHRATPRVAESYRALGGANRNAALRSRPTCPACRRTANYRIVREAVGPLDDVTRVCHWCGERFEAPQA